jgi:Cdc6-like AAA superfamily ATPase
MNISLTPSQVNLYEKIIHEINAPTLLRPNYVLTGLPGVGKTVLARYLCYSVKGEYISFTAEYGEKFLEYVDLLDIDGMDLLQFINSCIVENCRDKLFVIDDLEFVFNYMSYNKKVINFLKSYKRMYYYNKLILIVPKIFLEGIQDHNVYELEFNNDDRLFLADYYFIPKSVAIDLKNGYYFRREFNGSED